MKVDENKKFGILMCMHFPGIRELKNLCCEVCADFKEQYCKGKSLKGESVVKCMLDKSREVEIEVSSHKSIIQ